MVNEEEWLGSSRRRSQKREETTRKEARRWDTGTKGTTGRDSPASSSSSSLSPAGEAAHAHARPGALRAAAWRGVGLGKQKQIEKRASCYQKNKKTENSPLTLIFLLELARQVALDEGGLACWGGGWRCFFCLSRRKQKKVGVEKKRKKEGEEKKNQLARSIELSL